MYTWLYLLIEEKEWREMVLQSTFYLHMHLYYVYLLIEKEGMKRNKEWETGGKTDPSRKKMKIGNVAWKTNSDEGKNAAKKRGEGIGR